MENAFLARFHRLLVDQGLLACDHFLLRRAEIENQYEALENADALLIATEWSEFRTPDFNKMKSLLKNPVIFDGRNLFELYQLEECGFHYESVGRRVVEG